MLLLVFRWLLPALQLLLLLVVDRLLFKSKCAAFV